MYLQDTENKQSSTGASESGQLSDDSLRSEDYTSYGQGSPFPPGESAIPPKMTGGVPEFSLGQWLLVHLLLAIPIVNLIMLLIWAIGEPKPGKEVLTNYSRAHLIWIVISFVIGLLLWILFFYGAVGDDWLCGRADVLLLLTKENETNGV